MFVLTADKGDPTGGQWVAKKRRAADSGWTADQADLRQKKVERRTVGGLSAANINPAQRK